MAKELIKELSEYQKMYRDTKTGIVWVEDGSVGLGYSCHPNIDASGSIRGMKDRGYWGKKDRCVRTHGFIYNIDRLAISTEMDEFIAQNCMCEACVERRQVKNVYM